MNGETISEITDEIVADMAVWQNRPLGCGASVAVDRRDHPSRIGDSQVADRPVYVAIGVNLAGGRGVGGLWLRPAGGDGGQAVGDDAHRAEKPGPSRRVDRVL